MGDAAVRWREQLAGWAIPDELLAAAPRSPYGFSVDVFSRIADDALRRDLDPAAALALEQLPVGGIVLDVGCGAGAASLPLALAADRLVGVDESEALLAAFAERAEHLGVAHDEVLGRWPDVHREVGPADVVVCRHVVYNVPDLDGFFLRLTEHARRRVVVHQTINHPLSWMAPYWERLHGLPRPDGPTVDDAVAVADECGFRVGVERWEEPSYLAGVGIDERVTFLRRRLCVGEERDPDLRQAIDEFGVPSGRPVATLWWDGTATAGSDRL